MNPDTMPPNEVSDARVRRVELLISGLLRGGVLTSLALIVTGLMLSFFHHPSYLNSHADLVRLTRPGAAFPHTLRDVAKGAAQGRGQAVIAVGLILLIATPILRVGVSIAAFALEGDRVFVVITSIVLGLLLLSFVLGKAG
jgi:uncharacterized membrane protein